MNRQSKLLLIGLVSGSLLFIGLWQTEMLMVQQAWNYPNMSLPFGITAKWWFARDLWYAMIIAAFGLLIWTVYKARRFEV